MRRPRALDICCCAGGASVGLYRAGFDVVGVDISFSKNYPFPMIVCDALEIDGVVSWPDFDFIWASPPCQEHSKGRGNLPTSKKCIIEPLRRKLASSGLPYVIENVECAPIRADLILTGDMFGLNTYRKRHFEIEGFYCLAPAPPGPRFGPETRPGSVTVAGGGGKGQGDLAAWSDAMGIHWMTRREIVEAVPPAYSEYVGRQAIIAIDDAAGMNFGRPEFVPARQSAAWDGTATAAKNGRSGQNAPGSTCLNSGRPSPPPPNLHAFRL